ncbi:hypothetical protein DBR43_14960 [Pedobacter sp. KBW06]|uniref:PulJ/GspJ family protein n=1 Tax=Pedobacter sp. KBW06 TaxID=2153359 RepID=UPI000FA5DCF1|nr:hypothetical protein [Pedobacter sp. KBW06]RQO69384.1 hypothetical protein DBR43_14960 [Pedobacter sp. KBW06]
MKPGTLKASTLLEVIIAMLIILIVFVLATGIFTKVIVSSPSVKQQQVRSLSSGIIQESLYQRNWTDETIEIDRIVFRKTVLPYIDDPELLQISVSATEDGKEIGKSRQIVRKGREDAK